MRPYEGIRVIDVTHVLAGPFAAYQLALLGADVIKVDHPTDPDQARWSGADETLNDANMGTWFLTQGANKRSITLDLKHPDGKAAFKRLIKTADVLVENYRPGAFEEMGLGWDVLREINPRLIYSSMSAFGQTGPRSRQTAYDQAIQATSGVMTMQGSPEFTPMKSGPAAIDYATGTFGAFALSAALFQREKTGQGQRIDLAMMDVALLLMGHYLTAYKRTGDIHKPKPKGASQHSTNNWYDTKDGQLMLAGGNLHHQRRIWTALGRPEFIRKTNRERTAHAKEEIAVLKDILMTKTAQEWEDFFQERHIPATRVRWMHEALEDPHVIHRGVVHTFDGAEQVQGEFSVPTAAFKFAHGGPQVDSPPPAMGQHNQTIYAELGYSPAEIEALRAAGAI